VRYSFFVRLRSLDVLRGLAAAPRWSLGWWFVRPPVNRIGGQAVLVFFVLSGLVVTLPFLKDPAKLPTEAASTGR
jgi:peptidoglycan/LPS O-acetylase OafA/YrhL